MSLFSSIGKALGTVAKGVAGAVTGLARGGPLGAITGAIGAVIPTSRPGGAPVQATFNPVVQAVDLYNTAGRAGGYLPVLNAGGPPVTMPGTGLMIPDSNPNRFPISSGGGVTSPLGTQAMVPKGYHVNRLLVRAQIYAQNHGGQITPGMQYRISQIKNTIVKNRSLDVANVRALRRASQRAHGFIKLSRKLVGYYQAKKPKGRAFIKRRK